MNCEQTSTATISKTNNFEEGSADVVYYGCSIKDLLKELSVVDFFKVLNLSYDSAIKTVNNGIDKQSRRLGFSATLFHFISLILLKIHAGDLYFLALAIFSGLILLSYVAPLILKFSRIYDLVFPQVLLDYVKQTYISPKMVAALERMPVRNPSPTYQTQPYINKNKF